MNLGRSPKCHDYNRQINLSLSQLGLGLMEKLISSLPNSVPIVPEVVPLGLIHLAPREQDVLFTGLEHHRRRG